MSFQLSKEPYNNSKTLFLLSYSIVIDNSPMSVQHNVTSSADPLVAGKLPLMTYYGTDIKKNYLLALPIETSTDKSTMCSKYDNTL